MDAKKLYGDHLNTIGQALFDMLWNEFSSSVMGDFRRTLRAQGLTVPAAPVYSGDMWGFRTALVSWCDAILLQSPETVENIQVTS